MTSRSVGRALSRRRCARKVGVNALARKIGVDRSLVYRKENGDTPMTVEDVYAYCEALGGVTVIEVFAEAHAIERGDRV